MLALRHLEALIRMIIWVGFESDGCLILETCCLPHLYLNDLEKILRDIDIIGDDGRVRNHVLGVRHVLTTLFGDNDVPYIELFLIRD